MKKKAIKITGEVILVLSFLSQTLLFDYYNDKLNDLEKAYSNQSLIDKGAELKELKYFVANFPEDTVTSQNYKALNINMAAQKVAQAQLIAIIGSGKTEEEKLDLSNLLLQKAGTVNTFKEYMEFIDFINKNSLQAADIITNIESLNSRKKLWRFIFISFYLIGTIFLVYSIRYEKE